MPPPPKKKQPIYTFIPPSTHLTQQQKLYLLRTILKLLSLFRDKLCENVNTFYFTCQYLPMNIFLKNPNQLHKVKDRLQIRMATLNLDVNFTYFLHNLHTPRSIRNKKSGEQLIKSLRN